SSIRLTASPHYCLCIIPSILIPFIPENQPCIPRLRTIHLAFQLWLYPPVGRTLTDIDLLPHQRKNPKTSSLSSYRLCSLSNCHLIPLQVAESPIFSSACPL
ncbi:hypothetical protein EJ02DRAFT_479748, partial [Clathrospora elynae]